MRFGILLAGFAAFAVTWGASAANSRMLAPADTALPPEYAAAEARLAEIQPLVAVISASVGQANAELDRRSGDGKITIAEVRATFAPIRARVAKSQARLEALPPLVGDDEIILMANNSAASSVESGRQIAALLETNQAMWEARLSGDAATASKLQAKMQGGFTVFMRATSNSLRSNKIFYPSDRPIRNLFEVLATLNDAMGAMGEARFGKMAPKTAANSIRASKASIEQLVADSREGLKSQRAEGRGLGAVTRQVDAEEAIFQTLLEMNPVLERIAARLDQGDVAALPTDMREVANGIERAKVLLRGLGG